MTSRKRQEQAKEEARMSHQLGARGGRWIVAATLALAVVGALSVVGMATAYVDSTAVLLITGSAHTYMRGRGLLQEVERRHVADTHTEEWKALPLLSQPDRTETGFG